MVVTSDDEATRVGIEVLRAGGNAVDAAVATAFALAVVAPHAGNLGGGGFLLYRTPEGATQALDFREVAPRRLRPEMFLDGESRPVPGRSLDTGLAVGVPGSVAGLHEAHRRWGTRPWATLVAPAIDLAERGFLVSSWLAGAFAGERDALLADPAARAIFAPGGAPPAAGDRLVQPDLAASLRHIADHGPDGFYRGPVAAAVVRTVADAGGVLDEEDLRDYRPRIREPLAGRYRGFRVISFPPPSSGGVALLQMLGMLERHDLRASGAGSSRTVHLMVEAARRAYADRARWLGDPDFFDTPLAGLLDPDYLARRGAGIAVDCATPSTTLGPGEPPRAEPENTLHFAVADPFGGAVGLSTTLNRSFGCRRVAAGTGILLNDEMDDFALAPGVPNTWGLVGGEANAVDGAKRPLSSMTPTIVELAQPGARPFLVLGSPGGSTIITAVLQVLVNVVDHELPLQEAVDAPRFHHQWLPDVLVHERRAFAADVRTALEARGHRLDPSSGDLGNVNTIGLDRATGHWLGAADPRREGSARGF
jgi:gamma-glutamyltranspeptidase/glutathione hydrolase